MANGGEVVIIGAGRFRKGSRREGKKGENGWKGLNVLGCACGICRMDEDEDEDEE